VVRAADERVIESCRQWVETVIVALNFCPFAKPVVNAGRVDYKVINERGVEQGLMALSDQLSYLANNDHVETSLLIYPQGLESFDDYLDFAAIADDLLLEEGYEGVFQIATFHPDYCFEGQQQDDASNYTNRSPYPILHILREASIEAALEGVSSPDKIPSRNIELARAKGLEGMQALLTACQST
jgi:hypothetical protein